MRCSANIDMCRLFSPLILFSYVCFTFNKICIMENLDLLNNDLQLSPPGLNYLLESAKWGKFLAIMGFILCGIMAILSFVLPAFMSRLPPYNSMPSTFSSGVQSAMTIVYLAAAVLLFFPCLYLYKFSIKRLAFWRLFLIARKTVASGKIIFLLSSER